MANLHSINVFPADGIRTEWDFSFSGVSLDDNSGTTPYLYPEDVYAQELFTVGGIPQVVDRPGTLIGPTRFKVGGAPVVSGRQVRIFRKTEIRFPLVDYRDRQVVSERDLDLANRQAIFIAQETQDIANTSIVLDEEGNFDVNGRRIVNLVAGIDPGDAVNVSQLVRTIRVPYTEAPLAELPSAQIRAGKLLSFDSSGLPELALPSTDSATALRQDLGVPAGDGEGSDAVAYRTGTVTEALDSYASTLGTHTDSLTELLEVLDPSKGAAVVPYKGGTVAATLDSIQEALQVRDGMELVLHAKTDGTDQTAVVTAFFEQARTTGRRWYVPKGNIVINPTAPIAIHTSGKCDGRFLVPKANQTFWFDLGRPLPGVVLPHTEWGDLRRGYVDISASNAVGMNLFFNSTEIQIERIGSGGAAYMKQEMIRCPLPLGSVSTPLVNTYSDRTKLTVTGFVPSDPITVETLTVVLTGLSGSVEANRASIVVSRDNVDLISPMVHNLQPSGPRPVAYEVSYCADVRVRRPRCRGFNYAGLGYGILAGTTIGLVVEDALLEDCRHGFTGAYNVDALLERGTYSRVVDEHWGDRMVCNFVKVYAVPGSSAFEYAGNDIALHGCIAVGGRSLLGIRVDTPSLGGRVVIEDPVISTEGESGFYYVFGFSSPQGVLDPGFTYTNRPRLPDSVDISGVQIRTSTPTVYGVFLGMLYFPHTAWGKIRIAGTWALSGNVFIGAFAYKDSRYQLDRRPEIIVDGPFDFGTAGTAIYLSALDTVPDRAFDVTVLNMQRGSLRYSGYSCNNINVSGSGVGSITNDNPAAAPGGLYMYTGCRFTGGTVSPGFKNHLINVSVFTGSYSQFPVAADISLNQNVRAGSGVTGLPADIRNNIVAPLVT